MWVLCLALWFADLSVRSEEASTALPVPSHVAAKLQALCKQYYPKAVFTNQSVNQISFEHEVTTFEFPYTGPPGLKRQATTQRGPKAGGILCRIYGQKGDYKGQLFMASRGDGRYFPFHKDRQHYRELFMVTYSPKRDMYLGAALDYPPDASEEFLKQFRAILDGFE